MRKRLYIKTLIFSVTLFVLFIAASVSLTIVYAGNTEKKIISETSAYIKNYLVNLETADYSFSADILNSLNKVHEKSPSFTEEAEKLLSSYHNKKGKEFTEWLYGKNIKTFIQTAVKDSLFLESADIFAVSGGEGKSLLSSGKKRKYLIRDLELLALNGEFTEKSRAVTRYNEKIGSFRFDPEGSGIDISGSDKGESPEAGNKPADTDMRVLELVFNFAELKSLIMKNLIILAALIFAGLVFFLLYLLPEIRFYFEGRLLNISNSLNEIIKGNRDVRIYLPGNDIIADIGSRLNSILDNSVQTDSELSREKEKFNILFENIPIGAVVLDPEGKLIYENSFIKGMFDGDYEPFPAVFYSVLNRADSDILFENLSYILSREKQEYNHRCRLFSGAFRHQFFEISMRAAVEKENLKFVIITFAGLSSTNLESPQFDYFKIDGMSRLAGTIANGLNNILQIINGYTEYLLLGGFNEDEFREVIENMIGASRRASILTRHLKIFSRENRFAEPVTLRMNFLVKDLETILKELFHSGIVFSITDDGTAAECRGDESQLEQVIINLCINAGEAITGDGTVEISTGTAEYTEKDIQGYPEAESGKYVYVKVKDTGDGIPNDQLRKIFEPFYSTRKNGEASGMGLSLSYSIVMNHKGFITVDSEVGKGSVFTVNIPAAGSEKTENAAESSEASPAVKPQDKTVLFVDDEELILSLGKRMLEKAGYNVLTASRGYEAVDFVKNYTGKIDIMVFDLVMPDISGREAVEMIYKFRKDIPVLYISGYAEKELNMSGDYEILGKPFKISDFLSKISSIIEKNK